MKEKIKSSGGKTSVPKIDTGKSFIKGLGFCAHGMDTNPSIVEVKKGKIKCKSYFTNS